MVKPPWGGRELHAKQRPWGGGVGPWGFPEQSGNSLGGLPFTLIRLLPPAERGQRLLARHAAIDST
jgi:hypothetical protein